MTVRIAGLTFIAVAVFTTGAQAQRKPARKAPVKKAAVKTVPPLDVRAAREKVDNQLGSLNVYLNKLGTLPADLERAAADAARGGMSQRTVDKIESAKENFVLTIRNLREGLSKLESEFRTKTALQKYLPTLEGVTDLATRSEDSAVAGRYVETKEPLREVVKKLTDTLASMPL